MCVCVYMSVLKIYTYIRIICVSYIMFICAIYIYNICVYIIYVFIHSVYICIYKTSCVESKDNNLGKYFSLSTIQLGFPGGSGGKESACNAGDPSSIPGSGGSLGEGHANPLQYSCLGNPMDRRSWWAIAHGVAKSWTQLSN